ncbi:MAG: hypothetical protein K2J46_03550, partial [Muribaculaceae bacterium]|nr:hypothetical protein [Muribaculaceae bacterium]
SVDGRKIKGKDLKKLNEGSYTLNIEGDDGGIREVVVTGRPDVGYDGGAFFEEPVYLTCGRGKLVAGNWTDAGALKYFSGGIKYRKTVDVPEGGFDCVELDLGLVDATCEVAVNGETVDVLMSAPYRLDITDYVKPGANDVEVLVYSTLSNHYQSVPSAYRGTPRAGLLGPVSMQIYAR